MHYFKLLYLILGEYLLLMLSVVLTYIIFEPTTYLKLGLMRHIYAFAPLFIIWQVVFYVEGLYSLRTYNKDGLIISLLRSLAINCFISYVYFYLFPIFKVYPKINLIIITILSFFFVYLWKKFFYLIFSKESFNIDTVLIGSSKYINDTANLLKRKPYLGFHVKSQITEPNFELIPDSAVQIVIDREYYDDEDFMKEILKKLDRGMRLNGVCDFFEMITGKIAINSISSKWFIENCGNSFSKFDNVLKNMIDKSVAIILIFVFAPIFIILIPILLIFSGRPLFYTQKRVGFRNKEFTIYKLRSMTVNAEKNGAQWASPTDSRVTRVGKFLRKSRLDEIPQLYNILNGDMSIVGPRPERLEIIESKLRGKIKFYDQRHLVKPGVTGWAQVNYRYGYTEDDSYIKLQYDLYYVKNKSFWLDIKILLRTIKTILTGMGH